jgi:hypothetical protein
MRGEGAAVPNVVLARSRGSLTRGDGLLEAQ